MFPSRIASVLGKGAFENTYSLDFDGSNDYVEIEHTNDLSFGDGSNDSAFSISAWVKMDDATGFRILSKDGGVTGTKREYEFMTETSDDYLYMFLRDEDPGKWAYVKTNATITSHEGSWVHLATTYDGGGGATAADGLAIYINGSSVAVTATNNAAYVAMENNSGEVYIGRKANYYANGKIDSVSIWDVELDADAVSAIYNSGTPIALDADLGNYDNSGDLQGWWRMGDGTLDSFPLIADQVNPTLGSELNSSWANGDSYPFDSFTDTFSSDRGFSASGDGDGYQGCSTNELISGTVDVNKVYKITFDCTLNSGTAPNLYWATAASGASATGAAMGTGTTGSHILYKNPTATDTNYMQFSDQGAGDFTISNFSVKEVGGNPGLMTNMASDDIVKDTP